MSSSASKNTKIKGAKIISSPKLRARENFWRQDFRSQSKLESASAG